MSVPPSITATITVVDFFVFEQLLVSPFCTHTHHLVFLRVEVKPVGRSSFFVSFVQRMLWIQLKASKEEFVSFSYQAQINFNGLQNRMLISFITA
jgi:hypothetical protein